MTRPNLSDNSWRMSWKEPVASGQLAVITGGSSGLGLGLVRACLERGMRVVFTYRTEAHRDEALELLGSEAPVEALPLEVQHREAVVELARRVEQRWGTPRLVVANAGVGFKTPAHLASPEDWELSLGVNFFGVLHTIQAFLPGLLARSSGYLAATASMSGLFPGGNSGVYTTSKFAVVGLMESLRGELAGRGVGISLICPGMVQGRIRDPQRSGQASSPHGMDALQCARQVLRGVEHQDLYVLTHPEFRAGLQERHQLLERSFPPLEEPQEWWQLEQPVLRYPPYGEALKRRAD